MQRNKSIFFSFKINLKTLSSWRLYRHPLPRAAPARQTTVQQTIHRLLPLPQHRPQYRHRHDQQVYLHVLRIPQHDLDVYPLHLHFHRHAHLQVDGIVHGQEFTHRQDAADFVDVLRIRGVYELVAADEYGGDVPDNEMPDHALHHGHSDLLLLQVLLKER